MVLQPPLVFPISVHDNIAYGRPEASREEVVEAARLARIHDMITGLPEGYDTVVGEAGTSFSEGEKQRLTIARAILRDAPILILDEPTSALDVETEAFVMEGIERLTEGRTTFIIAHRLSTVRALDRILVFDQGKIVEDGTHAALLARPDGQYRRLFERQAGATREHEPLIG
jgi:ABC-type multidrug transport system fused ATPase/permease subunit